MKINLIKNLELFYFVSHVKSIVFGMLGSMIILTSYTFLHKDEIAIGTINTTKLVQEFIALENQKKIPPNDQKLDVVKFAKDLEAAINIISKERHIILMPSEAVFAGSQDYTGYVKSKLIRDSKK